MKKLFGKVLLVYKKSLYQLHFMEKKNLHPAHRYSQENIQRLMQSHEEHIASLNLVKEILKQYKVQFKSVYRADSVDMNQYNLVLSVGGDGTFIEAASGVAKQPILGINSAPSTSVGHFCVIHAHQFEKQLKVLLDGTAKTQLLNRIDLKFSDPSLNVRALNEVLFCHERPAAISRYQICMGEAQESQKSSGLWVSSAAGSSGAIYSAGGKLMPIGSRRLQYKPRELFRGECIDYELKGGFVDGQEGLTINSEMREGVIYVDGCHSKIDFPYGSTVTVMNSLTPLRVVLDPSGNHFRDRAGKL